MIFSLLLSAVTILPSDRMAMADRLFNRGRYREAVMEYRALSGEKSLGEAQLLFRIAECERALGNGAAAAEAYRRLVTDFPRSANAERSRLQLALLASGEARARQLAELDSDAVSADVRAAALYHRGVDSRDPALLAKALQVEPDGAYAAAARFARGALMAESTNVTESCQGMDLLLGIFYAKGERAEEAAYLSVFHCYRLKRHSSVVHIARRYLRTFSNGAHRAEVVRMMAWSSYLQGQYAAAEALCGAGETDDLAYLKARCAVATDSTNSVAALRGYLERFPSGAYRPDAELALARREFVEMTRVTNVVRTVEAAERVYRLSGNPADGLRLGWAYVQAGRRDDADALYAQVARGQPGSADSAEALYARAMLAAKTGAWSKCEMLMAEALATGKLGDRTGLAGYWRGIAAIRIGHDAEARDLLLTASQRGLPMDEDREARLQVADIDYRAGRIDEAKAAYRKLVAEGATARMSAVRLQAVGELLGGELRAVCARELIRSASPEWRQVGGEMLGRSEEEREAYTAAIAAYRQSLAEPVKTASAAGAALRLGRLESRAGEHARAEETLRAAVTLNADRPRARAEAYLALARNAEAVGDFKSACGYATAVTSLFDDAELVEAAQRIIRAHPEAVR